MTSTVAEPGFSGSSCRLCGGDLRREFSLRVLHKYQVAYLKCAKCSSLQTERPYWMQEAYANSLSILDTGAGQRNLANLAAVYAASRVMHLNDVLDFGGGDGLLCRLLRDYRINCFVNDKYASATYAPAFTTPDFLKPGILLALEVMEHFEDPREDLEALFGLKPEVIMASTQIFSDQGPDWWYLAAETGQHVFFYSESALHQIAESHNYTLLICSSGYILFLRGDAVGFLKRRVLKLLLQRYPLRLISAAMRLLPPSGVASDFNSLRAPHK